jgi:hypothetical protein
MYNQVIVVTFPGLHCISRLCTVAGLGSTWKGEIREIPLKIGEVEETS